MSALAAFAASGWPLYVGLLLGAGFGTCRSCGATIVWALTPKGKLMPVDENPSADGNLVVVPAEDPRQSPTARYATAADVAAPHFKSHFATCPEAEVHRRGLP